MADIYKYDKLGRLIPGKTKYDKKKKERKIGYTAKVAPVRKKVNYEQ